MKKSKQVLSFEPGEIQKTLFVSASNIYGDKYIEHLLEQYKIYISSVEKISDRRQKANEFFLALNTGLVTLLGFISTNTEHNKTCFLILLASISGTLMCYVWYKMVQSYKGLNSGKFKVIHNIEARLPLALYETEWMILGEGKNKKLYWPFTRIELLVPWIFISIYLILLCLIFLPVNNIFQFCW